VTNFGRKTDLEVFVTCCEVSNKRDTDYLLINYLFKHFITVSVNKRLVDFENKYFENKWRQIFP